MLCRFNVNNFYIKYVFHIKSQPKKKKNMTQLPQIVRSTKDKNMSDLLDNIKISSCVIQNQFLNFPLFSGNKVITCFSSPDVLIALNF